MNAMDMDKLSTSSRLLPRPSVSSSKPLPRLSLIPAVSSLHLPPPVPPSATMSSHLPTRRSHIPRPRRQPSTSSTSTTKSSTSSSKSRSASIFPGTTHSSPQLGRQNLEPRVIVQCLGPQLQVQPSSGGLVQLDYRSGKHAKAKGYLFDFVFGQSTPLSEIRPLLQPLLRQVLDGYNGTVFLYGPAQCGKSCPDTQSSSCVNVMVHDSGWYNISNSPENEPNKEYLLLGSVYSVFDQDKTTDLLCPNNPRVEVQASKKRGTFVAGLTQKCLSSPDEMMTMIQTAQVNRYSQQESKAHLFYQLTFVDLMPCTSPPVTSAASQDMSILRRSSKKDISLPLFEMLVSQLGGRSSGRGSANKLSLYQQLPFHHSLLTRLLAPSLSGQANLLSLCTISDHFHPAQLLKFASHLRQLHIAPPFNPMIDDQSTLYHYRFDRQLLLAKMKRLDLPDPSGPPSYRKDGIKQELIQRFGDMESKILSNPMVDRAVSLEEMMASLTDEKTVLDQQRQVLAEEQARVADKIHTLAAHTRHLDNVEALQDQLRLVKTELEVTKLLVPV
ncbi:P-loop containing nucleoside triphosphate hydrolase protein [Hesseltinella vesiculosa]|uniref:P-loop containing nucleoside triphosphate hydrolase protein n=1 Tax=Hesseltinella vesiculosa TaxID=101127 RepID=A0A1X2GLS7_9FUNG|nr:P-loop containing nucleoside triphosphate hydrolase protein [Hesseltinella vesiculosa]